jgi:hypothetical protein
MLDNIKKAYLTNPDVIENSFKFIPYKYQGQYNKLKKLMPTVTNTIKNITIDLALSIISQDNRIDSERSLKISASQYFSKYDSFNIDADTNIKISSVNTNIKISSVNTKLIEKYLNEVVKELNLIDIDPQTFLKCDHKKFYSKLHILGLYIQPDKYTPPTSIPAVIQIKTYDDILHILLTINNSEFYELLKQKHDNILKIILSIFDNIVGGSWIRDFPIVNSLANWTMSTWKQFTDKTPIEQTYKTKYPKIYELLLNSIETIPFEPIPFEPIIN